MGDLKKIYSAMQSESFPETLTILLGDNKLIYKKRLWHVNGEEKGLRYGENPGQGAALYQLRSGALKIDRIKWRAPENAVISAISDSQMLRPGKHPGKTNLTDVDNGVNILQYLTEKPACVILKHNNPCGAAWASPEEGGVACALEKAYRCDRIASFGGVIVVNASLDKTACELIAANYFEVVAAPAYEAGTVELLAKRKNLRIMELPALADLSGMPNTAFLDIKSLSDGGLIIQKSFQNSILNNADFLPAEAATPDGKIVIARKPDKKELDDLRFAWAVEAGVISNSVIFAKNGATVAIGAGEQDRVGCVELAVHKAYSKFADWLAWTELGLSLYELRSQARENAGMAEKLNDIMDRAQKAKGGLLGSRLVSDGFFPFRDGVDVAIAEGVSAIAQPGGSLRDAESIMACNEAVPQVAMVFTGARSFKH